MFKFISTTITALCIIVSNSQAQEQSPMHEKVSAYVKELSDNACKCVDSLLHETSLNKKPEKINKEVKICLDNASNALVFGIQLLSLEPKLAAIQKDSAILASGGVTDTTIQHQIVINDKVISQARDFLERSLLEECDALRRLLSTNDKANKKSLSKNPKAIEQYELGIRANGREDHETAIKFYKIALEYDDQFAFCWDNLGLTYRILGQYDEAIAAYQKSMAIDPKGRTPLLNISYAYLAKGDVKQAISSYKHMAKLLPKDPESHYGLANIYINVLHEYEKGLDYACEAYKRYVVLGSSYKQDAITLMKHAYDGLKSKDQEATFNKIMKKHKLEF